MKAAQLFTAAMCWFALMIAPALAQEDELRAQLQSRYDAMKAAMAARDAASLGSLLAPGFTSVEIDGHVKNADAMLSDLAQMAPDPNRTSSTTLNSVERRGDEATVEQTYDARSVRTSADGAQHHIEMIARSTDTWSNFGGVWQIERTVTDEISLFTDGHLTAHRMKPAQSAP